MKSRISNPFRSGISAVLSVLTLGCFAASFTQAASIYWDGTSASWNTNTNWSTASGADTPDPVAVPGAADDAIFNITTVNDPETITLDANQAVNSMTFDSTGTTALTGGGTARTLTLGTGGITVASTAGAVTLGDTTAGNNVLLSLSGAQTWTNNSATNAFTISNTAATFTRATGATLTLNQASTGDFAISTTAAPLVNTIIGPWAFFGTGADQKYAVSGATVTGLTGTTTTVLSHTGATTNYVMTTETPSLTLGGGNYASNTLRYTASGDTFNFTNSVSGGSSYTTNGILAVGASGTLTLRNTDTADDSSLKAGSTGELVIAGRQAVTINVPIVNGTPTASRLIYSGSNTLILGGANTYTGTTTVSSGTLRLNSSLALQDSPLNTTGSIAGNSTNGLKTTLTALTLGGLTGDKDLASLFTTTAGGYSGVANLTLNPGSSASSYSGVIANGAANMNLIKTGAGAQSLSGVNTYTGTTTISAGALILNNATALGTTPGVDGTASISMAAGTTLRSNYIIADAGNVNSYVYAPITLTGTGSVFFLPGAGSSVAPAEAVTFNLNGAIGGTAGTNVVFSSPTSGTSNADSIFVLGAASTYDGNTTITVGNAGDRINVKAGVADALPTTTVLTFGNIAGSGTGRTNQYDLNGNNQTLGGLDNGGEVPNFRNQRVTNSGALATLTINNAADFTFGGATTATNGSGTSTARAQITGNIALIKSGSGTLTLGGTLTGGATAGGNTYTGATTINGGTLAVGLSNMLPTTPVSIGGGTLAIGATFTDTVGTLALTSAASINLGDATSALVFADSSGETWTGPLTLEGFVSGSSLRFGDGTGTGLTPAQLASISASGFTGFALNATGFLTATATGGGFSSWITGTFTNGTVPGDKQGPNDDFDNDGISNLVEYAVDGQDPTVPNTSVGSFTANVLSFTKRAGTSGLTYAIQESTDLGIADDWTEVSGGSYVNDATTISYTLTPGTPVKNFTRLRVVTN